MELLFIFFSLLDYNFWNNLCPVYTLYVLLQYCSITSKFADSQIECLWMEAKQLFTTSTHK